MKKVFFLMILSLFLVPAAFAQTDLITLPEMTSENTPAPYVVSASSVNSATREGWTAFESSVAQGADQVWITANGEIKANLTFDFGASNSSTRVTMVSLFPVSSDPARSPRDFRFGVSDDNVTYTITHTETGNPAWDTPERNFTVTTPMTGRYFRLFIDDNNGDATLTQLGYVQFYHQEDYDADPQFVGLTNDAGDMSWQGNDVIFDVTVTSDDALDTCWFTHNDTGSFVNGTVTSCSSPFAFQETVTITSDTDDYVCGFFTANTSIGTHASSSQSCFTVVELNVAPTVPVITAPTGSGLELVTFEYSSVDTDPVEYRIFVNEVQVGVTNDTSFGYVFPDEGVYGLKVDAFDGMTYSAGNGSGFYEVTGLSTDLPLQGLGDLAGMAALLLLVITLFLPALGGKK